MRLLPITLLLASLAAAQPARPVPFEQGGKWGFIDRMGTLVIPLRYDEVEPFKGGRAHVRAGDR